MSGCEEWATTKWCGCFNNDLCKGWHPVETCNLRAGKLALLKEHCSNQFQECLATLQATDPPEVMNLCVCEILDCMSYGMNYKEKKKQLNSEL